MLEPPKDLPPLSPPATPKFQAIHPARPEPGNMVVKTEQSSIEPRKNFSLPIIEMPRSNEIIISTEPISREKKSLVVEESFPEFDEAIKSIHKEMMKITNDEPQTNPTEPAQDEKKRAAAQNKEERDYYTPKSLGEGYFSEIKHYLKNKDAKEIMEDILKKDFLTGMKDYHEHKTQGKPYYLHKKDLKDKLERQMAKMMEKEEAWHELKTQIEEGESQKKAIEKEIDAYSSELKALFKLIKTNQLLEREAKPGEEFLLKNGQKLKSLNDLRKALTYLGNDEFSSHANEAKNDFANWTHHALGMPEAAEKIRKAASAKDLERTLAHILD